MDIKYHQPAKTLGPRAAQLIVELYERRRPIFTMQDVQAITGLSPGSARSLVFKARQRGLITHLKSGLYNLVPFELGRASEHVGNPHLIVGEIVGGEPYYLSHGTAFELHRMVTQPNLVIYATTTKHIRPQTVGGYPYRFIQVAPEKIFGIDKIWITKEQSVPISDPERTIIDGLRLPNYVGGVSEVAKGLWMKRDKLSVQRLLEYAHRLNVGSVIRRLGYLLELYEIADKKTLEALRQNITPTYQRLDPLLPNEGRFLARWRLQLNIEPEELLALRSS